MLEEARASKLRIEIIAFDESAPSAGRAGFGRAETLLHVTKALMRELSDVETAQGVVALAVRPTFDPAWLANPKAFILILDRVQDPGNVGTLIRSAEAAGASGVLLTRGCADPLAPKALRASAGSAFRLPHVSGLSAFEALAFLPRGTLVLAARTTPATTSIFGVELSFPLALALGSEGSGLGAEFAAAGTVAVRIPHARKVESLNVAAAGSVAMFEIARRAGQLS